jgi:hypothetical protein
MDLDLNGLSYVFRHLLHGRSLIPDSLQAPGEAETTLSAMSANGNPFRIDAILTDDSDSFVFSTSIVLRMYAHDSLFILIYPPHCHDRRSEDNENYEASRYSVSDITTMLGITREDLILLAILLGGDYSASFQYYSDKLDLPFYPRTDYMGADSPSPWDLLVLALAWSSSLVSRANHMQTPCAFCAPGVILCAPN